MENVRGYWDQSIGIDAVWWCLPNPAGPSLGFPHVRQEFSFSSHSFYTRFGMFLRLKSGFH